MAEFAISANRNVGQNNPEIGRKERLSLWIRPGKRQINPEKGRISCGFDPEKGRIAFTQAAPEANPRRLKTM
jgi:hypothetical protein